MAGVKGEGRPNKSQYEAAKAQTKIVEGHIKWCKENGYIETADKETELVKHWQRWIAKYA